MTFRVPTDYREQAILIDVSAPKEAPIRLKVYDEDDPTRIITDRVMKVKGKQRFYVYAPLVGKNSIIEIFDQRVGNRKREHENTFEFLGVKKRPLVKKLDRIDVYDNNVREFINFAQSVTFYLNELEPDIYRSSSGKYQIEVKDSLNDGQGAPVKTPARISVNTGLIQINKPMMLEFSMPMRMAILLHEFSHFYLNDVAADEMEADLNGLLIYLSLGYPRIEAFQAFNETFQGVPSQENLQRYQLIENFIEDFEKDDSIFLNT